MLHIELRRWADLFVIAPLDANTLGKIASGICDNLLVRCPMFSTGCGRQVLQQVLCRTPGSIVTQRDVMGGVDDSHNIFVLNWQTCVVRAWDSSAPLLFCPAMNTAMWKHPVTARQIDSLKDFGYVEIPCIAKKLVCGDEGLCVCVSLLLFKKLISYLPPPPP